MKCFWSEAYWQVRRNDENTKSTVYRKLVRKCYNVICEDILMRCDVISIFDCAGVLICTPSNQIIEVYKQVAK